MKAGICSAEDRRVVCLLYLSEQAYIFIGDFIPDLLQQSLYSATKSKKPSAFTGVKYICIADIDRQHPSLIKG
jgi:hypothetical protein